MGRFGDLERAFLGELDKPRSELASVFTFLPELETEGEIELEVARGPKEPSNTADTSFAAVWHGRGMVGSRGTAQTRRLPLQMFATHPSDTAGIYVLSQQRKSASKSWADEPQQDIVERPISATREGRSAAAHRIDEESNVSWRFFCSTHSSVRTQTRTT